MDELEKLMSDVNPIIRAKALEAFRKTTGLEAVAGVHVSVNQQTAILQTDRPRSFEEVDACSALKPLAFVTDTLDELRLHRGHPPPPHTASVT